MPENLVERLRSPTAVCLDVVRGGDLLREAAGELERLQIINAGLNREVKAGLAEEASLQSALEQFRQECAQWDHQRTILKDEIERLKDDIEDGDKANDRLGETILELRSDMSLAVMAERERCARLVEQYVCSTANLAWLVDQIRNPEST